MMAFISKGIDYPRLSRQQTPQYDIATGDTKVCILGASHRHVFVLRRLHRLSHSRIALYKHKCAGLFMSTSKFPQGEQLLIVFRQMSLWHLYRFSAVLYHDEPQTPFNSKQTLALTIQGHSRKLYTLMMIRLDMEILPQQRTCERLLHRNADEVSMSRPERFSTGWAVVSTSISLDRAVWRH